MIGDDDEMGMPAAKRMGPPDVDPVVVGPTRFEALHFARERGFAQNGGYIVALDNATGRELWTLRVYENLYDPEMEEDVQDIFVETIRAVSDERLEVEDEQGRKFLVDPIRRTSEQI